MLLLLLADWVLLPSVSLIILLEQLGGFASSKGRKQKTASYGQWRHAAVMCWLPEQHKQRERERGDRDSIFDLDQGTSVHFNTGWISDWPRCWSFCVLSPSHPDNKMVFADIRCLFSPDMFSTVLISSLSWLQNQSYIRLILEAFSKWRPDVVLDSKDRWHSIISYISLVLECLLSTLSVRHDKS